MFNAVLNESAGEWYLGVYCRKCHAPIPVFHDPGRGIAAAAGTGKLTVACPHCRRKNRYGADEVISFLVYPDWSIEPAPVLQRVHDTPHDIHARAPEPDAAPAPGEQDVPAQRPANENVVADAAPMEIARSLEAPPDPPQAAPASAELPPVVAAEPAAPVAVVPPEPEPVAAPAPPPAPQPPLGRVYRDRWADPVKRPQAIAELRPVLHGLRARADGQRHDVLVRVADLFLDYLGEVTPERQNSAAIEQYVNAVFALAARGRSAGGDRVGEEIAASLRALNRHAGLYTSR